jgi:putative transposase
LIHAIWETKNRLPQIHQEFETILYEYLNNLFDDMNSPLVIVNGMPDHIHCLFHLSKTKSVSQVIKHVKGGSSFLINENDISGEYFAWQKGYAAYSVSEINFNKVFEYIKNQKVIHGSRNSSKPWV